MRTRSREGFTTIITEGSILPPDLLARIVERDRDLDGLDPGSYHLAGQTLNEAISRSWTVLQGAWAAFKDRRAELPEGQPETQMTRERWLLPLFRELDYGRLETMRTGEIEGKSYAISHRWRQTPIHLVGFRTDLDKRTPGVAGAARVSPHGLVQEFLNRSEEHLWAFLSDGLRLRILRDNASLTRQAYVEFDLEAMMDGEVYPDFVLLWLLCHQSRVEADRPEECYLEQWSQAASEQGTRALEGLRDGVEEAIASLGSGFLSHRANDSLKGRLRSGELEGKDYYRQLLRLVYRLLFLFVAEDRGLLLDPEAEDAAKDRYTHYYSTRKLRDVAEKRVGARHSDLYKALSLVMGKLGDEDGCPELGLPALGGFLFGPEAMPDLAEAEISNRDLLDAVRALSLVDYDGARRPVDYKNLGAEELGSVYESLLELQPELDSTSGTFTLRAVTGNERKTTGSYYTPHSLVTSLLDTALDPVLEEAARKPDPEAAILDLKVCDPAVGSGHFLIAAAHRIARRLASVHTGDDEPSPDAYREALRDVIGRCLYGVDVNLMAAELCKVSLWMEALVPGRPLSFLDHHIRIGNSLLGTTPELVADGIPNDAFKPIVGDDKKLTNALKKRNREERKQEEAGQLTISLRTLDRKQEAIEQGYEQVEDVPDESISGVRKKEQRHKALESSSDLKHARLIYDAWCAAFVWPKRDGAPEAITHEVFASLTHSPKALPPESQEEVQRIGERYNLFHWHLEFPNVFDGRGGFDVVLGNPPWERIKLQEQEWFAARRPEISAAPNAAARKRLISRLKDEDPALHDTYLEDLRQAEGESHLIRSSGSFPLCGRGDVNTYSIFAETNRSVISSTGRVGCIVPSGIATDNTTKEFFGDLVNTRTLASLYDFENRKAIFPGVHRSYKFSLLTMTGSERPAEAADFAFFALDVADLKDPERRFPLTAADIHLLNPNTRTCPIFRTHRDAEITKEIYRRVPVLMDESKEGGNSWGVFYIRLIDYSDYANDLEPAEHWVDNTIYTSSGSAIRVLPVYESKLIEAYDHRYGTYVSDSSVEEVPLAKKQNPEFRVQPRYLVRESLFRELMSKYSFPKRWFIAYRDVARSTDIRSVIATALPRVAASRKLPVLGYNAALPAQLLLASMNTFVFDFAARQKLGGISFSFFILKQLPVLPPNMYSGTTPWGTDETLHDWISPRVLELTYTAWDLAPFARDLGYDGPPFRWDRERRFLLRCELDAAFFHLYGIGREDADYILETFRIVKRKDEATHGEYRTKRVILEIYDQMAEATETGQPYQTPLDPPPVDLDLPAGEPATVTPLRTRAEPAPSPPQEIAAEDSGDYTAHPQQQAQDPNQTYPEPPEDTIPREADPSQLPPKHRGSPQPTLTDERQPNLLDENDAEPPAGRPAPEIPNLYEASLALNACLPDGQKVEREPLLHDAARELGHQKLTRKVRRALNKALNAEHNAGRLKTDWERVWKPRRK